MFHYIVLTAVNAVTVLEKSGFKIKEQWSNLARHLGLPLAERKQLLEAVTKTQDYLTTLEEALEWWTSSQQTSWELLISSVEQCSDQSTADSMRRQLGIGEWLLDLANISN